MLDLIPFVLLVGLGIVLHTAYTWWALRQSRTAKPSAQPPARNPGRPEEDIALEREIERLKAKIAELPLELVEVTGLEATWVHHVGIRTGRFASHGLPPHKTIGYTFDKTQAVAWLNSNPGAVSKLKPVWRLPDGRIAHREDENVTLRLIPREIVQ